MVPCWFRKVELHDLHAIIDIDHIYPFELHPPKIIVTTISNKITYVKYGGLEYSRMRYPAYYSVFMYKCT